MSYRWLKYGTVYPGVADGLYSESPADAAVPYAELRQRLLDTRFGSVGQYARALHRFGVETEEHFVTIPQLQRAWAREHGVATGQPGWEHEVVLAQARAFAPDIVFLEDLYVLDRPLRAALREACPGVRLVGWRSAPTDDFGEFGDLDLLLSSAPQFIEEFRRLGHRGAYLPWAFDPEIWPVLGDPPERDLPLTFVGQLGPANGPFSTRYDLVSVMLARTPLRVWSREERGPRTALRRAAAGAVWTANRVLRGAGISEGLRRRVPLIRRGAEWRRSPVAPTLHARHPDRFAEPVYGLPFYRVLARSVVTLNSHIDCASVYACNMRLFEATGLGACLLTDWKENLADFFEPEREVVTYRTPEECAEKARWLLDHPAECAAIAAAGRARVERDHTYAARAQLLEDAHRSVLEGAA